MDVVLLLCVGEAILMYGSVVGLGGCTLRWQSPWKAGSSFSRSLALDHLFWISLWMILIPESSESICFSLSVAFFCLKSY